MKKLLLAVALLAMVWGCGYKNKKHMETTHGSSSYFFLVGTYTERPEDGIHLVGFDPEHNLFESISTASEVENPSFLIRNGEENLLFAAEETGGEMGGKVTSFRIDRSAGTLQKINSVYTHGGSPCHLSLDPSERFLISSNYSGGSLAVIPVDQKGNLSDPVQVIQHQGSSVNPERQEAPHVHSTAFHPHEPLLFVADLGTDMINVYRFEQDAPTPLAHLEQRSLSVEPGAGPRHLAFNRGGDRLYLIHELTGELGVYSYEHETLSHMESHPLLSDGFEGDVGAAEVRISPDGDFIYASNRGDANDITALAVSRESGRLSAIQRVATQGLAPRNFAITPDGKYLICGNQNSDQLVAFSRDQETGLLSATDFSLPIKKPAYILFLNR